MINVIMVKGSDCHNNWDKILEGLTKNEVPFVMMEDGDWKMLAFDRIHCFPKVPLFDLIVTINPKMYLKKGLGYV